MNSNDKVDLQFDSLQFFQLYWNLIKWLFVSAPWLVAAWYCFTEFTNNTPAPAWVTPLLSHYLP